MLQRLFIQVLVNLETISQFDGARRKICKLHENKVKKRTSEIYAVVDLKTRFPTLKNRDSWGFTQRL